MKHSRFAFDAALEAKHAKSVYMVTLTYSNATVPIMVRRVYVENGDEYLQESHWINKNTAFHRNAVRVCSINMDGSKILGFRTVNLHTSPNPTDIGFNFLYATPSLRREDVRLFLKKCRVQYERDFGDKMTGRYVFFGEYGDLTKRPHYHGLLFDFSDRAIQYLRSRWEKEYGFCEFRELPYFNSDGSPARIKAANYVSKYIAKSHKYYAVEKNLVEAPRRFCSRGFGTKCLSASEVQSFKNFTNAKI